MLQIVFTVLLFGSVVFGVVKKFNTISLLITVSTIALILWSIGTGLSVAGDKGSGSSIIDVFELLTKSSASRLSSSMLNIMAVLGYVFYMNFLKASDMFALLSARPLMKVKNKYILAAGTIFLGSMLKIVITSAQSVAILLLATLYPVLLACGVTKKTATSAIIISTLTSVSPVSGVLMFATADVDYSPSLYFVNQALIQHLFPVIVLLISFPIINSWFDKKEGAKPEDDTSLLTTEPSSLGIPYFYALFPIIPLIMIIVFSEVVLGSIIISIPAAYFISMFIATIIHMIVTRKNLKQIFNDTSNFYKGMGNYIARNGFLAVAGTFFAEAVSILGGVDLLISMLVEGGGTYAALVVGGSVVAFITIAVLGSFQGSLVLFSAFFGDMARQTGGSIIDALSCMYMALEYGSGCTLVSSTALVVSSTTEVEITTLVKRQALPSVLALIASLVSVLVFFPSGL